MDVRITVETIFNNGEKRTHQLNTISRPYRVTCPEGFGLRLKDRRRSSDQFRRLPTDMGYDVDPLARDKASPEIQADLDRTRALSDIFGFIDTPGLVIGRTVLKGAIPDSLLQRIAKDEKSRQTPLC